MGYFKDTDEESERGESKAVEETKICNANAEKETQNYIELMPKNVINYIIDGSELDKDGWDVYKFEEEFERQGVPQSEKFRSVNIFGTENHEKTCIARLIRMINEVKGSIDMDKHTYPEKVYIPASMSDEEIAR